MRRPNPKVRIQNPASGSRKSEAISLAWVPGRPRAVDRGQSMSELLPTGIESLDKLLAGGLPRGRITEISGSISAGRTGLLFSILAASGRRGESLAYVDTFDMLDPSFLNRSGVDTRRLLWIRCRGQNTREQTDQSIKAADVVARAGGFGILVLDLAHPHVRLPAIATSNWFRLQRTLKGTPTSLLVLSPTTNLARATTVSLNLQRSQSDWGFPEPATDAAQPLSTSFKGIRRPLLEGIYSRATLTRGSHHGRITLHCRL